MSIMMNLCFRESKLTCRMSKMLKYFQENARDHRRIKIVSRNSFPTKAGLASSASGLCCLGVCLAEVYDFREMFVGHLSTLIRKGSGSACRSLYGGFV